MVRLDDVAGKSDKELAQGAYFRCFGDLSVSRVLSRIQGLVIKNGYELENIVAKQTRDIHIHDLDEFLAIQIHKRGVRIAIKKVIRKSNILQGHGIEPDFIIFQRTERRQSCYIVELKDGHEFDTKSSAKEHQNLHTFLSKNAMAFSQFQSYCKVCGFNATTRGEIRKGFKNKIAIEQAMTGKQFCDLLGLDYTAILKQRAEDRARNLNSLVDELIGSETVKAKLMKKLFG